MSVPLDRLYDFLHSVNDHDLIIYGWRPHGSKKIQDLKPWNPVSEEWKISKTQPVLIFHDQEPLSYEFWQTSVEQNFCDAIKDWSEFLVLSLPGVQQFYKTLNFKSVLGPSFYDLTLLVHSEQNSPQVKKYLLDNIVTNPPFTERVNIVADAKGATERGGAKCNAPDAQARKKDYLKSKPSWLP
jgi:hypothetical protein